MKNNQKGYVLEVLLIAVVIVLSFSVFFVRFKLSDENTSGVVYNTTNNKIISGNTHFSVRAAEDTYVSEENRSSYCLPPNSPYIDLVNKAAENKKIKVIVTADKYFAVKAPWTCVDNVKVAEVEK